MDNEAAAAAPAVEGEVKIAPAGTTDEQGECRRCREIKFGFHLCSVTACVAVAGTALSAVSRNVVTARIQGDIRLRSGKQVYVRLGGTGKHSKLQNARNSADADQ